MPSSIEEQEVNREHNIRFEGGPLHNHTALVYAHCLPPEIQRDLNEDVTLTDPKVITIGPLKGKLNGTFFPKTDRYSYLLNCEEQGLCIYAFAGKV